MTLFNFRANADRIIISGGHIMRAKGEKRNTCRTEMTVKGRKVTLHFTEEPNPDVAMQVKRLLLGTCLLSTERQNAE